MKKLALMTTALILFFLTPVFAGDYADGYGVTPKEAIESAREGAAKAVQGRGGQGCVGGGNGAEELIYVGQKGGLYHFKAHYHHHNGSCDKQLSIKEHLEKFKL